LLGGGNTLERGGPRRRTRVGGYGVVALEEPVTCGNVKGHRLAYLFEWPLMDDNP
jgi:hypothetical protein